MLIHINTLIIPLVLALCAIIAAGEASLLSISKFQLESLRAGRPLLHRRISSLVSAPEALLSTVIISNETLNIILGTAVASSIQNLIGPENARIGILLSVLASSLLLLLVSEILPKVLAFKLPLVMASLLVYPIELAYILVTPFRRIFTGIARRIMKTAGIESAAMGGLNEQDILTLVEVGTEKGSLDKSEQELIINVFQFSDKTVQSIMTPWAKTVTVPDSQTIGEVLEHLHQRTYSRIPVLSSQTHAVIGILYTKQLLKQVVSLTERVASPSANFALLTPFIVSAHQKIPSLFREFKQKKLHFALVVDEYGNTVGIATLDDVLNALFHPRKKMDTTAA